MPTQEPWLNNANALRWAYGEKELKVGQALVCTFNNLKIDRNVFATSLGGEMINSIVNRLFTPNNVAPVYAFVCYLCSIQAHDVNEKWKLYDPSYVPFSDESTQTQQATCHDKEEALDNFFGRCLSEGADVVPHRSFKSFALNKVIDTPVSSSFFFFSSFVLLPRSRSRA